MKTCPLCDSKELEIIGSEVLCKTCGYGHSGNANKEGLEAHLQKIAEIVMSLKIIRPDLTPKEMTNEVQTILHRIEKHPTRKDGFCEYCGKITEQNL